MTSNIADAFMYCRRCPLLQMRSCLDEETHCCSSCRQKMVMLTELWTHLAIVAVVFDADPGGFVHDVVPEVPEYFPLKSIAFTLWLSFSSRSRRCRYRSE